MDDNETPVDEHDPRYFSTVPMLQRDLDDANKRADAWRDKFHADTAVILGLDEKLRDAYAEIERLRLDNAWLRSLVDRLTAADDWDEIRALTKEANRG